jgi:hypothetical protein
MSTLHSLVTFADLDVPVGTVVASYEAVLSDGQVAVFTVETPNAVFTVAPGTYTVTARALAADGSVIGTAVVSSEVVVVDAPATIKVTVPASIFVSVGA